MRLAEWCWTFILCNGIFNMHRTTITDSFSCILYFRRLYFSMNMCYFINFTLKYVYFLSRNVQLSSYLWRPDSCLRSSYTLLYKSETSRMGVNCGKPCQVGKKTYFDFKMIQKANMRHYCDFFQRTTIMIWRFRTDTPWQTVQTQIRLEEQSDQGLHCLPFCLHRLDSLLYGRAT